MKKMIIGEMMMTKLKKIIGYIMLLITLLASIGVFIFIFIDIFSNPMWYLAFLLIFGLIVWVFTMSKLLDD